MSSSYNFYAVSDAQSREHDEYKNFQYNYQQAAQRLRYGRHETLEHALDYARAARAWAYDEAIRRREHNVRWYYGAHDGIEQQAEQSMVEVGKFDDFIKELEQELDGADRSCYNTGTGEIDYSASIDENDEDPSGGQSEYYTRIFERLAQMAFPTYHNDESIQEEYSWWDDGYDDQTYDEGHYYEDGVYEGENESEDVAYDGTYDAGYDYDDGTYDHGYGYYQE